MTIACNAIMIGSPGLSLAAARQAPASLANRPNPIAMLGDAHSDFMATGASLRAPLQARVPGLVALAVPSDPVTDYSLFDTIVFGGLALFALAAAASIIGTLFLVKAQRRAEQQEQAEQRAMSAETRLDKLLVQVSPGRPNGVLVREPIAIADEREALKAGLNVLSLWHERLSTSAAQSAWEMVLIKEQRRKSLPPRFCLMISPDPEKSVRPYEVIIARAAP